MSARRFWLLVVTSGFFVFMFGVATRTDWAFVLGGLAAFGPPCVFMFVTVWKDEI